MLLEQSDAMLQESPIFMPQAAERTARTRRTGRRRARIITDGGYYSAVGPLARHEGCLAGRGIILAMDHVARLVVT